MRRMILSVLLFCIVITCLGISSCSGTTSDTAQDDHVYQASTLNAIKVGLYDGFVTMNELEQKGDFGIGTFDRLEGEMVMLDSVIYKIKTDGVPTYPDDDETAPYAVMTFFEGDIQNTVSNISNIEDLGNALDRILPTKNIIFAVKITGRFDYIKTRSVPGQNKPYPPLADVVKIQATFEFNNVKGTILGFRYPDYMAGINLADYHLHFLTEDAKAGGHLLDCKFKSATANIDECLELDLELPDNKAFFDNPDLNTGEVVGE